MAGSVVITYHVEEVIAWCRDRLAHCKCPRRVVFGELPKTSAGKIQKFILKERARVLP
jgi:fatty-acyl-CoA synthase